MFERGKGIVNFAFGVCLICFKHTSTYSFCIFNDNLKKNTALIKIVGHELNLFTEVLTLNFHFISELNG